MHTVHRPSSAVCHLLFFLLAQTAMFAQKSLLQSGPMLGHVDMKEAVLWAQTKQAATVQFEYWDAQNPGEKFETAPVRTEKSTGFTAKCIADQVEPGRTYIYQLKINKKRVQLPYPTQFKTQTLWQWRTDPPAFSIATGSCAYVNEERYDRPGKPYGADYQIFTNIAAQKPDAMIWLGDNVYYREPDWATRTGMLHRYTHDRSIPELQPLLASTSHYAIWDDHDYGPDNSDGTWPLKETSLEVFKSFWANPTFGVGGQPSCATSFQYGDVDVFMLDGRYFRTPDECNTCERTCLGKAQLEWFLAALAASHAPFKLVAVGGQMLTTSEHHETFAHYYAAERDTILARIEREKIKGVVFLTGDRHFTELSGYQNRAGNWVYDLTASPFTSGPYTDAEKKEQNAYRIAGTVYDKRNFAMLRFSGPRKDRQMQITVYGSNGEEIWTRVLKP